MLARQKKINFQESAVKTLLAGFLRATTHQTLYMVTESGQVAAVGMATIPEVEDFSQGGPFSKSRHWMKPKNYLGSLLFRWIWIQKPSIML